MVVFVDSITMLIGASSADCTTIGAVESVTWNEVVSQGNHSMYPITVMNSVNPVAWRTTHKWVEGELIVKEYISTLSTYISGTATNTTVPYVVCKAIDNNNATWTNSFSTAYFDLPVQTHKHEGMGGLISYKFVANAVTTTAPV